MRKYIFFRKSLKITKTLLFGFIFLFGIWALMSQESMEDSAQMIRDEASTIKETQNKQNKIETNSHSLIENEKKTLEQIENTKKDHINTITKTTETIKREEKESKTQEKQGIILHNDDDQKGNIPEIDASSYRLANPSLIDGYTKGIQDYTYPEHMLISIFMGSLSGVSIGLLTGLSQYDSNNKDKSNESMYMFAGILGATGAIIGGITAIAEYSRNEQFTIGNPLMQYAWYGTITGALAGMAVGLIPYSQSQNKDKIINYGGYGAGLGFLAGMVMYIVQMPENLSMSLGIPNRNESGFGMQLAYKM